MSDDPGAHPYIPYPDDEAAPAETEVEFVVQVKASDGRWSDVVTTTTTAKAAELLTLFHQVDELEKKARLTRSVYRLARRTTITEPL